MRSAGFHRQRLRSRVKARLLACAFCAVVTSGVLFGASITAVSAVPSDAALGVASVVAGTGSAPGVRGDVHRSITRAERSLERFALTFLRVAIVWAWIFLRVLLFFVAAALASVVDRRLLSLWRSGEHSVGRYVGGGIRTFFSLVADRRTPNRARLVLGAALLYWLLPYDLVVDGWVGGGYADDLIIAVMAARLFIRLCPERLIGRHAALVASRLRG